MNRRPSLALRCATLLLALGTAGPLAAQDDDPLAAQARALALAGAAPRPGVRVEVEPGRLDPRLKLAPCARIEPYLPPGFRAWGSSRVGLRCADGPVRWNVYLPITVKVWGPAVVATAALPAGATLSESDLQVAEVDLAASGQPAITDPAAAIGRPLALALNPGESLRASHLRARQWFAAGETVKLVASGPGFAVQSEGLALAPGVEGRAVRVRTDSGRIVTGQPVGERRVELAL
ncbi:MAG TPA: flagellar basal body P-ring formation chaperone FlgA [Methylibium sp.]|nr:flagellar basal body P-ring formation chaperone FlgA [Methylibium sp.]